MILSTHTHTPHAPYTHWIGGADELERERRERWGGGEERDREKRGEGVGHMFVSDLGEGISKFKIPPQTD